MTPKTFVYKDRNPEVGIGHECPVKKGETIYLYNPEAARQPAHPIPYNVAKVDISEDIAMGFDVLVENSIGFRLCLLFDRGGWIGFSMRGDWDKWLEEDTDES